MAILKAGVADATVFFNLNGLDYPKNQWEIIYSDKESIGEGIVDKEKVDVGLKRINGSEKVIQSPIPWDNWFDDGGTPYGSLDELLEALVGFVGFKTSQGGETTSDERIVATGVSGTYVLDHSLATDWKLTLTGATTLEDANMTSAGDTSEFTIKITGDAEPAVPAYWDVVGAGTYNPAIWNFYAVQIHNPNAGSEEVTCFISQIE